MIYMQYRNGAAIPLIKIMMRDGQCMVRSERRIDLDEFKGIVYFTVIFVANVVTVTLYVVSIGLTVPYASADDIVC